MKLLVNATLIAFIANSAAANSAQVCMATGELEASLVDWYNETPTRQVDNGSVLWTSSESGTWTLVAHKAGGESCVVETGQDWSMAEFQHDLVAQLN